MMHRLPLIYLLFIGLPSNGFSQTAGLEWLVCENQSFTLHYTAPDSAMSLALTEALCLGIEQITIFFGQPYRRRFDVWCFPDRTTLDRQWQHDWGDSTFLSSCWMVASGVAHRLDLLTPRVWDTQACEHNNPFVWSDTAVFMQTGKSATAFRRLLTHELTHVYHGQYCQTPDFTGMEALGWWVEGLATYVSGQLDSVRQAKVRIFVREGNAPAHLDQFWSGLHRYGLSGSVVAALNDRFGRQMLLRLLPLNNAAALFAEMKAGEAEVLLLWRAFLERPAAPK